MGNRSTIFFKKYGKNMVLFWRLANSITDQVAIATTIRLQASVKKKVYPSRLPIYLLRCRFLYMTTKEVHV